MSKENVSALAAAALAYDQELRRFGELSGAARKTKLNSERNLARAAESLQKAGESQQRLLEHVRALVTAMTSGRTEQEAEAQALVELGQRIQARRVRYGEVFQKMADLGGEAKAIQDLLVGNPSREALDEIRARMEGAARRAEAIAGEAGAEEMEDLQRQADSLRQQLLAAKNKLQILAKKSS